MAYTKGRSLAGLSQSQRPWVDSGDGSSDQVQPTPAVPWSFTTSLLPPKALLSPFLLGVSGQNIIIK